MDSRATRYGVCVHDGSYDSDEWGRGGGVGVALVKVVMSVCSMYSRVSDEGWVG